MLTLDQDKQHLLVDLAAAELGGASGPTPEDLEVEKLGEQLAEEREAHSRAVLAASDIDLEIRRIQQDLVKLQRREQADRKELGAATDRETRKDLEHDLASAARRSNDLTGELKENHDAIAAQRANQDLHAQRVKELEERLAAAQRAAAAAHTPADDSQRAEDIRAQLPEDILAAYDKQKVLSEFGAAAFTGRACGGCNLILPAADIQEIRSAPANVVPQCPECGTYLVR
ncbi:C4-type zinc ribbon domain-containing protein [Corynebacterium glucuronolyticum]|uniref:zinc ribbon domain-containing protein n=1 Tax=Corynebacterium glucuronolyticum TaxID=39791 RepID=UPI003F6DD772